jgi:HIV Tat-specific factor 1
VILKYIFTLEELDEDPAAYFEIKEDIEEEAGKHGSVNKVALYDKEVDGIVSVHFREFEGAEAFRAASHGRNFDCRKIEATIADDRPKFRKSGRAEENSSDEERLERAVHG